MNDFDLFSILIVMMTYLVVSGSVFAFIKQRQFGELLYSRKVWSVLWQTILPFVTLLIAIDRFVDKDIDYQMVIYPVIIVYTMIKSLQGIRIYDEGIVLVEGVYRFDDINHYVYHVNDKKLSLYTRRKLIPGFRKHTHKVEREELLLLYDKFHEFGIKEKNDDKAS